MNQTFAATSPGPVVGDQAIYSMLAKDSSTAMASTFKTVTEILSLNASNQTASVQQSVYENGMLLTQNAYDQALTDIAYPTNTDIQNCADEANNTASATIESIKVKAGTFQSCHLKSLTADNDGNFSDTYLATVPFGLVKSSLINPTTGATQIMELQSYRKN